jgi:predicted O-methyltransferase YrrM
MVGCPDRPAHSYTESCPLCTNLEISLRSPLLDFASQMRLWALSFFVFAEERVLNESTVRTAQVSRFRGAATEKWGLLEMLHVQKPLLSLARRLHENETALALMRNAFRMLQGIGISVSPNHYYWPVPDFRELELRKWPKDDEPVGVDLGFERQLDFLQYLVSQYQAEWISEAAPLFSAGYIYNNGFFEAVDAEIAYSLVRHYKPRRIVEVGGGYSSRVLAAALDLNFKRDGVRGELVTIDPNPADRYPKNKLNDCAYLIAQPVQQVDLDIFFSLQSGDFLFLDSSHVVGVGSDVVREYLEIVPRLSSGVLIHAHDIFIPGDYPRDAVLHNLAFWSEQYLLQALLTFNSQLTVLWGSSYMQSRATAELDNAFPHWPHSYRNMPRARRRFLPTRDGDRVWPSSFWMRRG